MAKLICNHSCGYIQFSQGLQMLTFLILYLFNYFTVTLYIYIVLRCMNTLLCVDEVNAVLVGQTDRVLNMKFSLLGCTAVESSIC
jgi:hypothetical protein